jgi:DNA repair protein RadA/Sms
MSLEKKLPLLDINKAEHLTSPDLARLPSGFPIFDRVFNGGFLQSSVYLIHASRGAGKTTFLLQTCSHLVSLGKSVIFFSFDEGETGIKKKCQEYSLNDNLPHFVCENGPGIIEHTLVEYKPEFVVIDSLQSLAKYKANEVTGILYRISKEARERKFALVIVGEERKDQADYLGSASIGHIVDVQVKMALGLDEEVIISTPNKNRDTDDKTSRCFFRRTTGGLTEILESETGYLSRHKEKAILGLAAFVVRGDNDFSVDEMTAVMDKSSRKASLSITGISQAKAKSLLAVLENNFLLSKVGFVIRANRTEKNLGDAELACMVVVLSLMFQKPIPVDTVFIGGVDNRGYLIPVDGMEQRVKRAEALGYKRIIGPKANGTQVAIWEEVETVKGVWKALGY